MPISTGEKLPEVTLTKMGAEGPEPVSLQSLTKGRKVVIFAVPGAYTPTCHSAHVPSFIRVKDDLAAKGVDEVICVSKQPQKTTGWTVNSALLKTPRNKNQKKPWWTQTLLPTAKIS